MTGKSRERMSHLGYMELWRLTGQRPALVSPMRMLQYENLKRIVDYMHVILSLLLKAREYPNLSSKKR